MVHYKIATDKGLTHFSNFKEKFCLFGDFDTSGKARVGGGTKVSDLKRVACDKFFQIDTDLQLYRDEESIEKDEPLDLDDYLVSDLGFEGVSTTISFLLRLTRPLAAPHRRQGQKRNLN